MQCKFSHSQKFEGCDVFLCTILIWEVSDPIDYTVSFKNRDGIKMDQNVNIQKKQKSKTREWSVLFEFNLYVFAEIYFFKFCLGIVCSVLGF